MKIKFTLLLIFLSCLEASSQSDTSINSISRNVILSEVVIRNDLDVNKFLQRVKDDTSFYKAFRNLRALGFTSLNDIRMVDKKGKVEVFLYSKTKQLRENGCRSMEVIEEKITGDIYDSKGNYNYYTANLYASLFFTRGKVCGETNIVAGIERDVRSKSGMEKHKKQLKMMFFNPG